MLYRFPSLRAVAVACLLGSAVVGGSAHAALFDDNEARKAVLDLRTKTDSLASQLSAAQRTILDQSNRLDQLNQQVATLRGQNEDLANQLTTLQKQQKDYYTDLDGRLKKFEPQQQTVDGVQGTVQPGETESFNASGTATGLTDTTQDESPSFAANGQYILYATQVNGRGVLAAVSTDGRTRQVLSLQGGSVREPSWGPFMQ